MAGLLDPAGDGVYGPHVDSPGHGAFPLEYELSPSFSTGVNGVVGRLTGWPTWAGSRTCSHQVGVTLT